MFFYTRTNPYSNTFAVDQPTSSDISVAMDRPISWNLLVLPVGPSRRKIKRVGTGTSVMSPRMVAFWRRTNATIWWLRKSTSPTRMLDASAPGGIFFMKWRFCSNNTKIDNFIDFSSRIIFELFMVMIRQKL